MRTLLENNKELYAEIESKVKVLAMDNADLIDLDTDEGGIGDDE